MTWSRHKSRDNMTGLTGTHNYNSYFTHTQVETEEERERLALCPMAGCQAYPVAKALTSWQALVYDLLEHLSLSLSVGETQSQRCLACSPVWPMTYSLYDKSKSSWKRERKLEKIFSLCKFNGRMSQNFMSARGFFPFAHILFFFSFPILFLSLSPPMSLFLLHYMCHWPQTVMKFNLFGIFQLDS